MNEKLNSNIKKEIQSFFDKGTVTMVGSGLSCAEGLPSMRDLAKKLIEEVPKNIRTESHECWLKIEKNLSRDVDLETTLIDNKANSDIESAILKITYELISEKDIQILEEVIKEERELDFSCYLSRFNTDSYDLSVITTNYDLLIEYACEKKRLNYSDSFYGKIISEFSMKEARNEMINGGEKGKKPKNKYKKIIKIYKPHGSINWKFIKGKPYRINNVNFGTPCIITPGCNKYEKGYKPPFDEHINTMSREIDKAKKLVFIGYGFNDNHLQTHLNNCENKQRPVLIISKTLSENAKEFMKNYPNTIAIEAILKNKIECGSRVYSRTSQIELNKNIWKIKELIKEVFNE